VLFYFITFTLECFTLAVAATTAELKAILLNNIGIILCHFVIFAHNGIFCKILHAQNRRILIS